MKRIPFLPMLPKRRLCGLILSAACALAFASPPPVRQELHALADELQRGACRLQRNGSWHSAAEARAHLLRKLDYLERRGAVASTEQFIELAGSRSSVSGEAYQVQCGRAQAQPSRDWLLATLSRLRLARAASAPR